MSVTRIWDADNNTWRLVGGTVTAEPVSGLYLPLSGGTLTGPLTLAGAPISNLQAATKLYVDQSETDGAAAVNLYTTVTGFADAATVTLSIPSTWGSWKCFASATFAYEAATAGSQQLQIMMRINGTDGPQNNFYGGSNILNSGAVIGRRTGITATGACPVDLRARTNVSPAVDMRNIYLYARALRTS